MAAIKRNLKYWGYSVEMLVLAVLGVTVLLGLLEYTSDGLEAALDYLLGYMPMMCIIAIAMLGFVGVGTYFPFSMAMGSTRKASFVGMQVMAHAMAVQIVLLTTLINFAQEQLFDSGEESYTLTFCLFWIFFSTGICNVISAISMKCGRLGATIAYILFVCVGESGLILVLTFLDMGEISTLVQMLCLVGSIVFDILMGFICYLSIKKYEVRV